MAAATAGMQGTRSDRAGMAAIEGTAVNAPAEVVLGEGSLEAAADEPKNAS